MEVCMRKEFVSLDGVVEDPRWTFQFNSEEQEKLKFDELSASDALLLGRSPEHGVDGTDERGGIRPMNPRTSIPVRRTSPKVREKGCERIGRFTDHPLHEEVLL
jgi:hypothetical protein